MPIEFVCKIKFAEEDEQQKGKQDADKESLIEESCAPPGEGPGRLRQLLHPARDQPHLRVRPPGHPADLVGAGLPGLPGVLPVPGGQVRHLVPGAPPHHGAERGGQPGDGVPRRDHLQHQPLPLLRAQRRRHLPPGQPDGAAAQEQGRPQAHRSGVPRPRHAGHLQQDGAPAGRDAEELQLQRAQLLRQGLLCGSTLDCGHLPAKQDMTRNPPPPPRTNADPNNRWKPRWRRVIAKSNAEENRAALQ
ncbi:hypothetical protein SKAU_G00238890 [Synaphobranchus kaupii]|uniref:Uncharacterized protein n=1 Tax=Synaphobranchus kaupii TaxID=118154 RepID=A0A9Q1F793_SYNKA|nr:hypothetical protein SKAU_G00238890 [Synaphobranchus kaupii]